MLQLDMSNNRIIKLKKYHFDYITQSKKNFENMRFDLTFIHPKITNQSCFGSISVMVALETPALANEQKFLF